ncbi:probable cardiolipin synthase (CMP-forming) [Halyomorpha halys]|uniref:probable cardiolipin synthase (CMP-forming) n=1 Tax=Halyomorpha halys TaxID=286706 RepID=UPI0006D4F2A3|nr:probable cardiolipin synthase (CMP-forming) [Halyomorpha halys]
MYFCSLKLGKSTCGSKALLRLIPIPKTCISLLSLDNRKTPSKRKLSKERFSNNNKTNGRVFTRHEITKRGKLMLENIGAARSSIKEKMEAIIEKENIWTIPNILCCARIIASPYLGYLIYHEEFNIAFVVMLLAGLTDLLDGLIARNFASQASKLGSFLDPMADKILISSLCISLTCVDLMPVFLTGLILSRDVALASAGFYIRYKSLPPPKTLARYFDATHATAKLAPTGISKINTTVQLAAVGIGLMSPVFGFVGHPHLDYLWYFTATSTIASALSYVFTKDTYKILKKQK